MTAWFLKSVLFCQRASEKCLLPQGTQGANEPDPQCLCILWPGNLNQKESHLCVWRQCEEVDILDMQESGCGRSS